MPLSPTTREYLRRLSERDPDITPWREWCTANKEELETSLSRTGYLKLKFTPEDAVPELLAQEGIPFSPNELKKHLADAERGWRTPMADGYGVHELYSRGEIATADAILEQHAAALAASDDPSRGVLLGEMVLDAELYQRNGLVDQARGLAKAVAQLSSGDDISDPAIHDAVRFHRSLRTR